MIYKKKALEFSLVAEKSPFNSVKITRSLDAANFLRPLMSSEMLLREVFFILTLNRANNVTGYAHISTGGISGTVNHGIFTAMEFCQSLFQVPVCLEGTVNKTNRPRSHTKFPGGSLFGFDHIIFQ